MAGKLTPTERDILDFEATNRFNYAGIKEQVISDLFGLTPTRYHQILNALLDRPEALARQPQLVNRMRRMREAKQQARRRANRG